MLDRPNHCTLSPDLLLVIMEYLDVRDLCRCAQVSWSWYYINKSLDNTTWKRIFLRDFSCILNFRSAFIYFRNTNQINNEIIDENYLMNPFTRLSDNKTWKDLYRDHFNWKSLWKLRAEEVLAKSCACVIPSLLDKSEIHVGPTGYQFSSIREAMNSIHPYCTVIIHPGNYEEQIKISIIVPFQMIGPGNSSPITMYFDCDTTAVRMCNVFIKSPWFSEILLRVRTGFVQLESCNLMNGEIHVTSPGVLAMRYCNLENAKISFTKSYSSIIEHCQFNNNIDFNDFIHIEGTPKYERITACSVLTQQIKKCLPLHSEEEDLKKMRFIKKENTHSTVRKTKSCENLHLLHSDSLNSAISNSQRSHLNSFQFDINKVHKIHTQVNLSFLKETRIMHLWPYLNSNKTSGYGCLEKNWINRSFDELFFHGCKKSIHEVLPKSVDRRFYSKFIKKCCWKQEIKQFLNNITGPLIINCHFSNSKLVINSMLDANFIVINCEIDNCGDLIRLSRLSKAFIYHNRMHHSTGSAICLKHGAEAVVMGNEIYCMVEGAIEIRKKTTPHILANKIHSNGKCGISFISNNGTVEFNDICYNKIGISILHSSNPIIRSNSIRDNKSCGVIINERSISILDDNLIYQNCDSNILVRKMSTPVITSNIIYQGHNSGIQLEDGSKGTIANNVIMKNSKNGLFLLNADLPYIYGNQICLNKSHGIYISRSITENEDVNEEQDNDMENNSVLSYCDTTFSSEYDEFDYSRNVNDDLDLDLEFNRRNSEEKWIRRKNGLIHIEFNSIYFNNGCGILNETNMAIEILNNAIHANSQSGISLIVPGVFGLTYGSPKFYVTEPCVEFGKKIDPKQQSNTMSTFVFEGGIDEPKVSVINRKVTPYLGDNHSQWKIRHRTLGQVLKNSITENGVNGITINTTHFSAARFVIIGNGIYDNLGTGTLIQTECEMINNDILGNKTAIQAKPHAWIYLTLNRLNSLKDSTIRIYEPSTSLICKNNILYTNSLKNEVIRIVMKNRKYDVRDNISVKCFNAFRSTNIIEYTENGTINPFSHNESRNSSSNSKLSINSVTGLHNQPLRPIIIKDTQYVRVSVALSDALNSFNRSSRSEICQIL